MELHSTEIFSMIRIISKKTLIILSAYSNFEMSFKIFEILLNYTLFYMLDFQKKLSKNFRINSTD